MVTTASEIRAHLGVGYAPFCRAHLGRLCDIDAVVVTPTPLAKGRQTDVGFNALNRIVIQVPGEQLDKARLKELAQETAELAQLPEVQTWASSVFSRAGRQGVPLETETELAKTLLAEAKISNFFVKNYGPLTRTLHFAAGMVATGVHVTLVAHGDHEVLTRLLSAVYVDGEWRYADPASSALGKIRPFNTEEQELVPHLETPEEVVQKQAYAKQMEDYAEKVRIYEAEVLAYQKQVAEAQAEQKALWQERETHQKQIQELLEQTQKELLAISRSSALKGTPLAVQQSRWTFEQKMLLAGAVAIAVYTTYQLLNTRKRLEVLEGQAKKKKPGS